MNALAPLRVAAFRRLAGAYAISRIGDVVALVALALVVWDRTHSTFATTGLFVALEFLPALAGPPLTARLDRVPVARVLGWLYVVEAAVFVALALLSHSFSLAPFLALVAIDGAIGVVARAICRGAVATVLEPTGRLREGNALLNMALAPNMAIGGMIGALVAAGLGADVALMANAATFAIGSLLVGTARSLPRYDADGDPDPEHWRTRLAAAVEYVRGHRTVLVLLLGQAAALIFFAMTEPIEVAYTRDALDAGAGGYGALIAAWGIGVLIGSFIYTWAGSRRLGVAVALSTLLQGGSYLALGVAPDIAAACAIAVIGGMGNGAQLVAIGTAIQEAVAIDFQARVMSMYEALCTATPGLGYLVGGAVAAAAGTGRAAFLVAGAGVFAVMALVAVARPWRSERIGLPVGETFNA